MSYVSKRGKAAAESAVAENSVKQDVLKPFKSGTSYKVRVLSPEDFVEYYAASVYKVFNTTPVKPGNLYQKAADALYAEAKALGDGPEADELRDQAYQLKPKPRYLFGFANLEDGEPMIVDVSKKQAQTLIAAIDKYAKRLDKLAFELAKTGSSTSTTVTLSPIIDMDEDLTDAERKNFEAAAKLTISDELFESVLYVKTEDEQAADLIAFGFDPARIGYSGQAADPTEEF